MKTYPKEQDNSHSVIHIFPSIFKVLQSINICITKQKRKVYNYSSFSNPLRECGTAGALVLHPSNIYIYIYFFSTAAGLREHYLRSSAPI